MSERKPWSEAAERNREPILAVLQRWFTAPGQVLEIGAGTGQHAVYFAANLPHLTWICTDREDHLAGIALWLAEARLPNVRGPLRLDVLDQPWPAADVEYAYSANTAHIMSWRAVEAMFSGLGRVLAPGGVFCLYGPFNRDGEYTSDSNRRFDAMLRTRDPHSGVRNDRDLIGLAARSGLMFAGDHSMPANNRVLVWRAQPTGRSPATG